jgi:thymidylate kinase
MTDFNYVAIEGVKGVGKSTAFGNVLNHLKQQKVVYSTACPTQRIETSIWDYLYKYFPSDFFKEQVYAFRSNRTAQLTNWQKPLVLGDRSIATSYVSRLWHNNNPKKHICRVDKLEPLLPSPSVILYLKAETETIMGRLHDRTNRFYGKEDETFDKINADLSAYIYLQKHPSVVPRLKNTKWQIIDANLSQDDILEQIILSLSKYE